MRQVSPFGRFCILKRKDNRQLLIQMADAIGVSAERLSSAELGECEPAIEWLPKIREFLKLSEIEAKKLEKIMLKYTSTTNLKPHEESFASAAFKKNTTDIQEIPK